MAFNMKGFSPFTKQSGKEYRQMRRDKYDAYGDDAKDMKKEHRKERKSLRKSQRREHGLFGALGERSSEKKALRSRQMAERHDKRADFMSELKSDRKKFGGRRHLPWNWSTRPGDPEGGGHGVSPMHQNDEKKGGKLKTTKKEVKIPKKEEGAIMQALMNLDNPTGDKGQKLMAKLDSINPNWRSKLENVDEID